MSVAGDSLPTEHSAPRGSEERVVGVSSRYRKVTTTVARWATHAQDTLARRLYVDTHDDRRTVFVSGTGRSGTTWLGDIINYGNEYRVMFEPFHPERVPMVRHFRYRQYLRPDSRDPSYVGPVRAILSGAVRNAWIDQYNRKLIATRRLIKDIRSNHLLGWIRQNAPDVRIVLLLRHPCAVAHSRLVLGWGAHLEEFLEQPDLMRDHLDPFRTELERAQTPFEKQVLLWCVENYLPLEQLKPGDYHLVYYELLCTQPEEEIDKLFRFLGMDYDARVLDGLRKPSAMIRAGSAVTSNDSLTESWRTHLTSEQIARSLGILGLFGLDALYSDEPWPCTLDASRPWGANRPRAAARGSS